MANKLLFRILSYYAIRDPEYENLSNWVSAQVKELRKLMDRPPWWHGDMRYWSWGSQQRVHYGDQPFSPWEVPDKVQVPCRTGTRGEPLAPPDCWNLSAWI